MIEQRILELANLQNILYTKERLGTWFKRLDELKQILEPHFAQKEKALDLEEDVKEFAVSQFKYNNLLGIVIAMGVYCFFKDKLEYIKYLWEYRAGPPDADATWVGHDIVPDTIDSLVHFYFNKILGTPEME